MQFEYMKFHMMRYNGKDSMNDENANDKDTDILEERWKRILLYMNIRIVKYDKEWSGNIYDSSVKCNRYSMKWKQCDDIVMNDNR